MRRLPDFGYEARLSGNTLKPGCGYMKAMILPLSVINKNYKQMEE